MMRPLDMTYGWKPVKLKILKDRDGWSTVIEFSHVS